MCSNFISSLDFLSPFESIRLNKSSKFKSFYGGIISLIVILFSLVMTFYISLEIFLKNEPKTSVNSIELMDDLDEFYFSKDEIQFFFALKFPNSTAYIDETIFKIKALQIETFNKLTDEGLETTTYEKNIDLKPCSETYNQKEIQELNINFPIGKYYCVADSKAKLKGFAGNRVSNSLKIFVEKCTNDSVELNKTDVNIQNGKITCRPIEEINSFLNRGYINILISNFFINEKNYDMPLIKYLNDVSDIISDEDTGLNYIIYYSKLKFINDDGLIFERTKEENVAKIFNIKNSFDFKNNNNIAFIQLELVNHMNTYKRVYPKIQDVLTKIGGFINAINILGYLLYYFYFKAFRVIDLIIENHLEAFNITLKKTNLNAISEYIQNSNMRNFAFESDKILEEDKIENNLDNSKNDKEKNQNNKNNLFFLTETHLKENFEENRLEGKQINIQNIQRKLLKERKANTEAEISSDNYRATNNHLRINEIEDESSKSNQLSKKSKTYILNKNKILNVENDKRLNEMENEINCNSYKGLKSNNKVFDKLIVKNENKHKRNLGINNDDLIAERPDSHASFLNEPSKRIVKLALKNDDSINFQDRFNCKDNFNNKSSFEIPINKHIPATKQKSKIKNIIKLKCEIEEGSGENNENNNIKIINNNILEFNMNNEINPYYSNQQLILNTQCRARLYENPNNLKKDKIPRLNKSELCNLDSKVEKDKEITNKNQENINKNKDLERSLYQKSYKKTMRKTGNYILSSSDFNFRMKKDLFLAYWCYNKNKKLNKILMNKEIIVNKYLSVENLTKISFDVKFLKYLYLDGERVNAIDRFYEYSILDDEKMKKLKCIILRENLNSSTESNEEIKHSELDIIEKSTKDKLRIVDDLLNFE